MPKLPVVKPQLVIKFLQSRGFVFVRSTGSHQRFAHPDGRKATIPYHNKPLRKGTLKSALRQADMTTQDLLDFLHNKKK